MTDTARGHWLIRRISEFKDRVSVIESNRRYTYLQLCDEIVRMTNWLRQQKIQQGQVVALLSDYNFKSIALFLALMENRNIIVPVTVTVAAEIRERLREAFADVVIRQDGETFSASSAAHANEPKHQFIHTVRQLDTSGIVLFSSGSTGKPKAMINDLDNMLKHLSSRRPVNSNILVFLMFDHIGGLNTLFNALASASTITIPDCREIDYICKLIEKHRVTLLPTSPTFLNLLMINDGPNRHDLSSLKTITYGTEPMSDILLQRLKKAFPDTTFLQTFGTSETGIVRTRSRSHDSLFIKLEDPNNQHRIVDGELWLKSKTRILGYLNAEMDNFTADGWYKTGDLVEEAPDGWLKIVGRIKELINVGGLKVLPEEVEGILLTMPAIADCVVYGQKNALTGQIVVSEVVLKNGARLNNVKKAVRRFCRDRLDNYKIPAKVIVVDRTNFSERFKKIRTRQVR